MSTSRLAPPDHARCPACLASKPVAIAPPRHGAMLSDGAPCGVSLRRWHCRNCGAGWLPAREARRLPRRTFGDAYSLGAAPPSPADLDRARGYAMRLTRLLDGTVPAARGRNGSYLASASASTRALASDGRLSFDPTWSSFSPPPKIAGEAGKEPELGADQGVRRRGLCNAGCALAYRSE